MAHNLPQGNTPEESWDLTKNLFLPNEDKLEDLRSKGWTENEINSVFGKKESFLDMLYNLANKPYIKHHEYGSEGFKGEKNRAYYTTAPGAEIADTISIFLDSPEISGDVDFSALGDLIAELPHGLQYGNLTEEEFWQSKKKDNFTLNWMLKGDYEKLYDTKGTHEYEAHTIAEPFLDSLYHDPNFGVNPSGKISEDDSLYVVNELLKRMKTFSPPSK